MNFQLNMNYKTQKHIKKIYGKNLGREIAFGRSLVKFLKNKYQPERLNPEDDKIIKNIKPDLRIVSNPVPDFNYIVCDSPNTGNK